MENEKVAVSVKMCGECTTCKYTRAARQKTFRYGVSRFIQKLCPACRAANKRLQKDFQKSIAVEG